MPGAGQGYEPTIATVETIAAGDNNIGNVDVASIAAGTNAIGKLAANSGVDIGDVDITSIAAGDNNIGNVDIVTLPSQAYSAALTITRPANTTAYTAKDILGGALTFPTMGPNAGKIMITCVQLEADITAIPSGQTTWDLYLYNVTPPSAVADNGPFDLPSGDRASFLGKIQIPAMTDEGSTCYVEVTGVNKQLVLAGTSLFGYLVTNGGFTPAANSEVYVLTLHAVAV